MEVLKILTPWKEGHNRQNWGKMCAISLFNSSPASGSAGFVLYSWGLYNLSSGSTHFWESELVLLIITSGKEVKTETVLWKPSCMSPYPSNLLHSESQSQMVLQQYEFSVVEKKLNVSIIIWQHMKYRVASKLFAKTIGWIPLCWLSLPAPGCHCQIFYLSFLRLRSCSLGRLNFKWCTFGWGLGSREPHVHCVRVVFICSPNIYYMFFMGGTLQDSWATIATLLMRSRFRLLVHELQAVFLCLGLFCLMIL